MRLFEKTFSKNCLLYSIKTVPLLCSPGRSSPSYLDTGDESGVFIFYSEGTTTYLFQQHFPLVYI